MNYKIIFSFFVSVIGRVCANCEPGYTLAGTYCYKFDASRKGDFDTQKRRCESEGSQLIEYPDYQSFEDLSAHVRSQYGRNLPIFWIGLKTTGGSNHGYANSYHWLSDNFGQNTKAQPGLLQWRKNNPRQKRDWLCVWTQNGVLRNQPCGRTNGILACQYDPLLGLNIQQDMRARDDRYYQGPPLRSSYAGRTNVGNLASDRQDRLNALRDQKNSGLVGYGTGSYGNSANSNNGMGYGVDSNNQYGSSQNQNAGNQNGNGGNGQYGNGGTGQNGYGGSSQYGNGGNGQYGNGGNGQDGNSQTSNNGGQIGNDDGLGDNIQDAISNGQTGSALNNRGDGGASANGGTENSAAGSAGSGTASVNENGGRGEADAECDESDNK